MAITKSFVIFVRIFFISSIAGGVPNELSYISDWFCYHSGRYASNVSYQMQFVLSTNYV